jgi:hypothetical protein
MAKSMSIFNLVHSQETEDGEAGSNRREAAAQQCLQKLDLVLLEAAASRLASSASGPQHLQQFEVHIEAIFLINGTLKFATYHVTALFIVF